MGWTSRISHAVLARPRRWKSMRNILKVCRCKEPSLRIPAYTERWLLRCLGRNWLVLSSTCLFRIEAFKGRLRLLYLHAPCLSSSHTDKSSFVFFIHIHKHTFLRVQGAPRWGHLCHNSLRVTFQKFKKVREATSILTADKSGDVSSCTVNRMPAQVTPTAGLPADSSPPSWTG